MTEVSSLRVGVLGAGGIAAAHLPAWLQLGCQVQLFSRSGSREMADRFGVGAARSVPELLASVDLVDICTPTVSHRELILAAVAAGRHVVCEKPLARTVSDSAEVIAAADRAGVWLLPAHVVRYFPEYVAAERAVRQGRIGQVAVARFSRTGIAPGPGTWFSSVAASGGVLMDLMIHDLDQARWICGEVETVFAVQSPPPAGDVVPRVVTAQVLLSHVGGAISTVQGVWGLPDTIFRTGFDIAGTAGNLHHDRRADAVLVPDIALSESPFLAQLREFAVAVCGGAPPRVRAADGFAAVALADAAARSLLSGTPQVPVRLADQQVSG